MESALVGHRGLLVTKVVDVVDHSAGPQTPPHEGSIPLEQPVTVPAACTSASGDSVDVAGVATKRESLSPSTSSGGTAKKRPRSGSDQKLAPVWMDLKVEGGKRARRPPTRFMETVANYQEELSLRQAIENSKIETQLCDTTVDIPEVVTYRPSAEEFRDPIRFIESVRHQGEQYGVIKIVPPRGWSPPQPRCVGRGLSFPTRKQHLKHFKEGTGFSDGKEYTADSYKRMAQKFHRSWIERHYTSKGLDEPSLADLEKDYWRVIEAGFEDVSVEYANDLDTVRYGSGFPRREDLVDEKGNFRVEVIGDGGLLRASGCGENVAYYERCGWNLNNMPIWPGSLLRCIHAPLKGVNVPWLYIGMLFSTFCWHNEDNYLYSVNYMHSGSPKQWYAVPGSKAEALEKVMKGFLRDTFQQVPDLLHHMTTHFNPMLFHRAGVPVYKVIQEAGTFIVTFPKSFHAGFSYGHNCAEAVNFASADWLGYGREAVDRYRRFGRPSVFSHDRLVLTLAHNLSEQWPHMVLRELLADLTAIVTDEGLRRDGLRQARVRFDVVDPSKLLANNLHYMDLQSSDYDDKRMCSSCKHVCFLSAVACECSATLVSCLAEAQTLCQCSMDKRFLLSWHKMDELWALVRQVEEAVKQRAASVQGSGDVS